MPEGEGNKGLGDCKALTEALEFTEEEGVWVRAETVAPLLKDGAPEAVEAPSVVAVALALPVGDLSDVADSEKVSIVDIEVEPDGEREDEGKDVDELDRLAVVDGTENVGCADKEGDTLCIKDTAPE
jgi:hypothetical protein